MALKALIFFPALSGFIFDGSALSGGLVHFYEPGTEADRVVYANRNKTVIAANPFELDANGRGEVFLDGVYDILITSSTGAVKSLMEGYEGTASDGASNPPVEVDTSAGDVVKTLPTGTNTFITYAKKTADANVITFITSDGSTIAEAPVTLDAYPGTITFSRTGNIWYKV